MLKMYHSRSHAGDADFWEDNWQEDLLDEALRFCEIDPIRPLFERYFPAGTRLLEGGCGRGQYVVYYSRAGVHVVGFDFAQQTLKRLSAYSPGLVLCGGDVAALPFGSGSFDAYFSGGVVEHFEAGPEPALLEAMRVLRPGGLLLASVPYLSPLRRASRLWRWDRRYVDKTEVEDSLRGERHFWQYAFGTGEFARILAGAGFQLEETFPYSILFGLYELPLLAALVSSLRRTGSGPATGVDSRSTPGQRGRPSLLSRLAVAEDRTVPILGPLVELAGRLSANMMMFVCRKPE